MERAAAGWSIRFNLSECEQGLTDVRIIFVSLFVHVFVYAQPADGGSIHLNPSECEQGLTDGGRLGRRRIALRIAHLTSWGDAGLPTSASGDAGRMLTPLGGSDGDCGRIKDKYTYTKFFS